MMHARDIQLPVNPDLALSYVRLYDRDIAIKSAKADLWMGAATVFGSCGFLCFIHPDLEPMWIDAFGPDCMPVVQGIWIGLFTVGIIVGTAFIIRGAVVLCSSELEVAPSVPREAKAAFAVDQVNANLGIY